VPAWLFRRGGEDVRLQELFHSLINSKVSKKIEMKDNHEGALDRQLPRIAVLLQSCMK